MQSAVEIGFLRGLLLRQLQAGVCHPIKHSMRGGASGILFQVFPELRNGKLIISRCIMVLSEPKQRFAADESGSGGRIFRNRFKIFPGCLALQFEFTQQQIGRSGRKAADGLFGEGQCAVQFTL